mmetsp:Transcript_2665/g.7389  ORF Transcript_2665/g.7389 Transcript_2665/m.7389 type:complete len:213 (-) Transcript_2665:299-937(-)
MITPTQIVLRSPMPIPRRQLIQFHGRFQMRSIVSHTFSILIHDGQIMNGIQIARLRSQFVIFLGLVQILIDAASQSVTISQGLVGRGVSQFGGALVQFHGPFLIRCRHALTRFVTISHAVNPRRQSGIGRLLIQFQRSFVIDFQPSDSALVTISQRLVGQDVFQLRRALITLHGFLRVGPRCTPLSVFPTDADIVQGFGVILIGGLLQILKG